MFNVHVFYLNVPEQIHLSTIKELCNNLVKIQFFLFFYNKTVKKVNLHWCLIPWHHGGLESGHRLESQKQQNKIMNLNQMRFSKIFGGNKSFLDSLQILQILKL